MTLKSIFYRFASNPQPGDLYDAVLDGDVKAVKLLLDKGANVNDTQSPVADLKWVDKKFGMQPDERQNQHDYYAEKKRDSALMAAIKAERVDIVGLLIERGARVDTKDENGKSVEDLARYSGGLLIPDSAQDKIHKLIEGSLRLTPDRPEPPQLDVPMAGQWQTAMAGNTPITRVPVADEAQAEKVIKALKEQGVEATMHQSNTLGLTVRVAGDDTYRVTYWQSLQAPLEVPMAGQWQSARTAEGAFITRLPVANEAQAEKAIEALKEQGVQAVMHQSETLGLTVRVYDADAMRIMREQKYQESPVKNSAPAAKPPKLQS